VVAEAFAHKRLIGFAPDEARQPRADVRACGLDDRELGRTLEHLPLEPTRLLLRLEPELHESLEKHPVRGNCICVTAASIESEHQEPGERLPERMLLDESLEIGQRVSVSSELEQRR
jgi:hypothetical protein